MVTVRHAFLQLMARILTDPQEADDTFRLSVLLTPRPHD
jgi:hypothetical protein